MSATVTQWFKGPPENKGVWEVETHDNFFSDRRWFSYFDGARWGLLTERPELSFVMRNNKTYAKIKKWRGLAEKP